MKNRHLYVSCLHVFTHLYSPTADISPLVVSRPPSDKIRSNRRRPMRRLFCLIVVSTAVLVPTALAQPKPTTQPATRTATGGGVAPVPPSQLLDSLLKPASAAGQPLQ